jgi:hypothetical protein
LSWGGCCGRGVLSAVRSCRRCGLVGGAVWSVVRSCRRCGLVGGAVLSAVGSRRRWGLVGGTVLSVVRSCRWCGLVGGAVLSAVWSCRWCGLVGGKQSSEEHHCSASICTIQTHIVVTPLQHVRLPLRCSGLKGWWGTRRPPPVRSWCRSHTAFSAAPSIYKHVLEFGQPFSILAVGLPSVQMSPSLACHSETDLRQTAVSIAFSTDNPSAGSKFRWLKALLMERRSVN